VATALECRRDGHWLNPTLEGQPRTKKPPLTAWITALAMTPKTVQECSSPNAAIRANAFSWLAWESRWPALAQACGGLIAIFFLGCMIGDAWTAAAASLLAASSYLFLRYAQVSQTDVSLMLWVTVANALLAMAIVRRRWWPGMIGGGAAIGLAFMAKGPVALVQTAVPWIVWKLLADRRSRWPIAPMLAGIGAFLLVALPWYVLEFLHDPHRQLKIWFDEVTGSDAPDRGEPIFQYLLYMLEFFPPLLFAIPAAWQAFHHRKQNGSSHRLLMMICLVLTPLIVMSFFKDKKDRYLLPMIGPIAILAATGLKDWQPKKHSTTSEAPHAYAGLSPTAQTRLQATYWLAIAAVPITFTLLAALGWPSTFRGTNGNPWLSWPIAAGGVLVSALILIATLRSAGNYAALFTLLFLAIFMHLLTLGYYFHSASGRSKMLPLANRIWAKYPNAKVFTTMPFGSRASEDLSIYMNRTTGWITTDQMNRLLPSTDPVVVLMRLRQSDPPIKLSAPWQTLLTFPKELGESWRAVVLPPQPMQK